MKIKRKFRFEMVKKISICFLFCIIIINIFGQVNNNCANSTTLTPDAACTSGTLSGSNVQAGEVTAAASHCGTANFTQSVWYSFTATSTSMWVELGGISLSGGGGGYFPGRLTTIVYNTSACIPGAGEIIGCDNHADNLTTVSLTGLTIGNTYLVQVGYNTANGSRQVNFCINISSGTGLPIELFSFTGRQIKDYNLIEWVTASEINNDYFTLERSTDGESWERINYTPGAGNSNHNISYSYRDYTFENKINYYRLTQFDFDGKGKESFTISIDNRSDKHLVKTVNLLGQEVDEYYTGLVINIYSDGTTNKELK